MAQTAEEKRPQRRGRQVAQALFSLAVVVGIFVGVFPRIANFSEVFSTIGAMTWLEVVSLLAAAVWNLATYMPVLMATLPGLTFGQATVVSQSGTAIANTLPGGGALGVGVSFAMLSSWGFAPAAITRSVIVSGIWNTFVKLGMPVVALALLAIQGRASAGLLFAALLGVGVLAGAVTVFALVLASERLARRVGSGLERVTGFFRRLLHKPAQESTAEAAVRFRRDTIGLLRGRWLWLTLATIVSHVSLYLVLLVTLRHVGVSSAEVGWTEILGAFAFIRLASALPITPGGLGVVELGLTAALVVAGGDREQVVAAVLVYRGLTYLLPIPVGLVTYIVWRRNRSWRHPHRVKEVEGPLAPAQRAME